MTTMAATVESIPETRIREALQQVVNSREFPASNRLRGLLTFLVEQTLAGQQKSLNQRELATAIFDRAADFDPEEDPIVRVEMTKLRKALKTYYTNSSGPHSLRFSIPRGRYVPMIEPAAENNSDELAPQTLCKADTGLDPARPQTLLITSFTVFSEQHHDRQFAESLKDELEVVLSRLPGLRVVSASPGPELADCQGFTLHGTVKHEDSRLRINVRLLEGSTKQMLWTERFECKTEGIQFLSVLDVVTATVLARVADVYSGTINQALIAALDLSKKSSFSSEEAMLFFYRYLNRHTDESYTTARRAVEDAWSRDGENAILTALLADVRRAGYSLGYTAGEDPATECLELARRALGLAPESAACKVSLGFALLHNGHKEELLALTTDILADSMLSPSYRGDAAMLLALSGSWQRGCMLMESVLAALPRAPHSFSYPRFLYAYREGRYDAALAVADQFRPSPLFWQPMMRAAALGQLGERARGEQAVHTLLDSRPLFPSHGRRWLSCFLLETELVDHLIEGLARAGMTVA